MHQHNGASCMGFGSFLDSDAESSKVSLWQPTIGEKTCRGASPNWHESKTAKKKSLCGFRLSQVLMIHI